MLRSEIQNKENHVAFNIPPKTPKQGGNSNNSKKQFTFNQKSQNTKTPGASLFVTPSRKPLGGKDANTHRQQLLTVQQPQTNKKSPAKRTPLSGKLQSKNLNILNENVEVSSNSKLKYEDLEIETIPEKPSPPLDLPLDHVEMDYQAIRDACLNPKPYHNSRTANVDKDLINDDFLNHEYTFDSTDSFNSHSTTTTTSTNINRSQSLSRRKHDFMAPTKSQQAKQRSTSTSNTKHTNKIHVARDKPLENAPVPQIDIHIDSNELDTLLF